MIKFLPTLALRREEKILFLIFMLILTPIGVFTSQGQMVKISNKMTMNNLYPNLASVHSLEGVMRKKDFPLLPQVMIAVL